MRLHHVTKDLELMAGVRAVFGELSAFLYECEEEFGMVCTLLNITFDNAWSVGWQRIGGK